MVMIILRDLGDGWFEWYDHPDDLHKVLSNGKTMLENMKDDITNDTDLTGHRKSRKTFLDLNVITKEEHDKWEKAVITP